ncbi:MAG: phosphate ABC transporter permease subunit PstC [Gaiellales bacterium]
MLQRLRRSFGDRGRRDAPNQPVEGEIAADGEQPRAIVLRRTIPDRVFRAGTLAAGMTTLVVLVLIGLFLFLKSLPALRAAGFGFFTTQNLPAQVLPNESFGIAALIYGTIEISLIALMFAVPVSIATALFINEYAPRQLRRPLTSLVELLAAVPSLIYGLWGFFYLQPHMIGVSEWLNAHLSFIPLFQVSQPLFTSSPFIAGTVVSLMVIPISTAVMREVFSQTPRGEKEGALALGATRWGMIRTVVLPFGKGGMVGGAMLGLGRALGETIAVAIILSPTYTITPHVLQAGGGSIPATIAIRFAEAGGLSLSVLMAAGLTLFLLTLAVNTLASFVVARSRSGAGVEI